MSDQPVADDEQPGQLTLLLRRLAAGDGEEGELYACIEERFREMASRLLRGQRPDRAPWKTDLIDATFMNLIRDCEIDWRNSHEFYRVAATTMRRLLINKLRDQVAEKRGGKFDRQPLSGDVLIDARSPDPQQVVELSDWMDRLRDKNALAVEALDLWVFGHRTKKEIAELMEMTLSQVETLIKVARKLFERTIRESK